MLNNWKLFISHLKNKADLAKLLTGQIFASADKVPSGCELVTAGGFEDILGVWSTAKRNMEHLR